MKKILVFFSILKEFLLHKLQATKYSEKEKMLLI